MAVKEKTLTCLLSEQQHSRMFTVFTHSTLLH